MCGLDVFRIHLEFLFKLFLPKNYSDDVMFCLHCRRNNNGDREKALKVILEVIIHIHSTYNQSIYNL